MKGSSQFKPLTEAEKNICERFSAARRFEGLNQLKFAKAIGATVDQIANIDATRVPLKYAIYQSAHERFGVNPMWLRTGNGTHKTGFLFDDSEYRWQIKPEALFSEVYDQFLAVQLVIMAQESRGAFHSIAADIRKLIEESEAGRLVETPIECIDEVLSACDLLRLNFGRNLAVQNAIKGNPGLTSNTDFRKTADVKREFSLPKLLADLKRLASTPEMKADLAKHLKVPVPRVYEWLAEKYVPSGEMTLELLNWVRARESK